MHIPRFLPLSFGVLLAVALPGFASAPIGEWDPAQGMVNGVKVVVPDAVGKLNLEGGEDTATTLERSESVPGGAAIVFAGTQTKPMRTVAGGKITIGSGTTLEMAICPDASAGDMTILVMPGFELRYSGAKQQLSTIVYYDVDQNTANYAHADLPAKAGGWSNVKVSISSTELVCEVAGETGRKQLVQPVKILPAALVLGIKGDSRPYKGKVGKITISQE